MLRDYKAYLQDMLEAVQKIEQYIQGVEFETFKNDSMRFDAVMRNLQIIGEAAKKIPPTIQDQYPDVQWRQIGDFRNLVVHEYFRVNKDVIWDILQVNLPELQAQVLNILNAAP